MIFIRTQRKESDLQFKKQDITLAHPRDDNECTKKFNTIKIRVYVLCLDVLRSIKQSVHLVITGYVYCSYTPKMLSEENMGAEAFLEDPSNIAYT